MKKSKPKLVSRASQVNLRLLAAQTLVVTAFLGLALFLPAGSLAWPAAWIFLCLQLGFTAGLSLWLIRHDPELLHERMIGIGREDQKGWDKVLLASVGVAYFGWLVLMGFDAGRYQWSRLPLLLQLLGAAGLLVSYYIFYLTFRENPYLSPAVRIQSERAQRVVSTGPYRYVRHPMYAGFLVYTISTALLLGSGYGLIGGLVLIALVAWRAVREERVLRAELPGYAEYMSEVRYRLVPYVW